ncbi:recombinase family protein [Streptomyces xanthii]|uniref:Recombinase family protein n=1 Tax=Streptomyces xanthii TaxID=2768069 RepID=A0A7H1BBC1_9ACTN|nr:recombinase family protein [Streptomyces xanthii]QNS06026.1 recombinase family protein [Streptomyces xanthii]
MIVVGGYTRISDVGQLGDGRDGRDGVIRQREDVYDLAKLRRCRVHRVYEDNDTSAYKRRTRRAGFEDMVQDLETGTISGVIAYTIDRIARQPRDLERLIDIYEQARRPMAFATTTGDHDLTTTDGRFQARIYVTVANKFSADAARRISRQKLADARAGRPHKGQRAFGWVDTHHVDEREAELVRQAHKDVLQGKKVSAVHREWAELGVRGPQTPPGKTIGYSSVLYVLRNPRLCGYRSYIPQKVRERSGRLDPVEYLVERTDGKPVIGTWETILSPREWCELIDELNARKQTGSGRSKGTTVTRRLLTGILQCARCGATLSSGVYQKGTASYAKHGYHYYCRAADGGCGRISRSGPPVEDHVEGQLLERLRRQLAEAKEQGVDPAPGASTLSASLRQIEADKAEARRLRADNLLSLAEFAREIRRLEAAEQHLHEMAGAPPAPMLERPSPTVGRVVRDWNCFTTDQKREELERAIETVVVKPAGKGGAQRGTFRPELIEIVWRS